MNPPRFWTPTVVASLTIIALLLYAISIPNNIGGGPTRLSEIITTLRQIEAAKDQWASEHHIKNPAQATNSITEKDLSLYFESDRDHFGKYGSGFDSNGYPHSAFGEKYIINPLGVPAEVLLTRKLKNANRNHDSLPKGTIIRLGATGEEIILPGQKPRQPPAYHSSSSLND